MAVGWDVRLYEDHLSLPKISSALEILAVREVISHSAANAANSGAISTAQDSRQTQLGLIYSFWAKGDCRVERITKETIVSATGLACRFHRRGLLCLVAR